MSQRLKACCCGDCVNGALGACCYRRGGGGTQWPTCECLENLTECACKNIGGVWNGSNNCATGCFGSCCLVENSSGRILSCQDNVTECDCALVTNATQTGFWMVGVGCYNNPCGIPCGPKLCNFPQSGYIQNTYTRTFNYFHPFAPRTAVKGYVIVTEDVKYVDYSYVTDVDASFAADSLNLPPQKITVVDDNWETSRKVETWNVSIYKKSGDCVEMGCIPNSSSYYNRTYDGYNGVTGCSEGFTETATYTGEQFYALINPCIRSYLGFWFWLDRFGNPACRILGSCEVQLVDYYIRSRLGYPANGCTAPSNTITGTSYDTCP